MAIVTFATDSNMTPCFEHFTGQEVSGSIHKTEFKQFLNIARRSLFEDASMILVFEKLELLRTAEADELLEACDKLSRKITNFSRTLGP